MWSQVKSSHGDVGALEHESFLRVVPSICTPLSQLVIG